MAVPKVISLLQAAKALPLGTFGDRGFQSARGVVAELTIKSVEPTGEFTYPLMEGSDVTDFVQKSPSLFLKPDRVALKKKGCRLRAQEEYEKVGVVIRQTAGWLIASMHCGVPFRNSLLAGYAVEGMSCALLAGLLNSALYRAVHLAGSRDVRQAVFPQVKIGQLRTLPRPPHDLLLRAKVADISLEITQSKQLEGNRARLDDAVFELFGVPDDHRGEIYRFLAQRQPKLKYEATAGQGESSLESMHNRLESD
jgi:hypothetical protein